MVDYEDNPFWGFSRTVYGRPGVAPACLALQDRHGLDVNMLLFCCFAGSRGRTLTDEEVQRLVGAVNRWQREVVQPLRAVRRWLKTQSSAPKQLAAPLRSVIKLQELEAERIGQFLLIEVIDPGAGDSAPGLAGQNLKAYLRVSGIRPQARDTAGLGVVLAGCFDELSPSEAMRLL